MMAEYEQLKFNLQRMNSKQHKLIKISELRQKHHSLEMEERKLVILHADKKVHDVEERKVGELGLSQKFVIAPAPSACPSDEKLERLNSTIRSAKKNISE